MKKKSSIFFWAYLLQIFIPMICSAQILEPEAGKRYYLVHSSSNVACANTDGRAIIQEISESEEQLVQFVSDGAGYYWVKIADMKKYMSLKGSWNTYFVADSTKDSSKYAIEQVSSTYIRLKCKANNKYLGTDNTTSGSNIYSDKTGTDSKHYWYISEDGVKNLTDTMIYQVNPAACFKKPFEGWGVSLCWWANMCGKWSNEKIDEIVDWLVSKDGLNYNIFRYNIGGGDDPLNRHCTPHHMANGKGLRAEMEGFKDSLNTPYNWSRDSAQRKIMLKIKEKRPDAIFEAFSNSPPYYMTYSGCCAGNVVATDDNLKPEYYEEFAHYLVDVCKFYKDSFGIEFKTLESFNEPVTALWFANGVQEGCHFSTAAQIAFLKVLDPILKGSGLKTIISSSDETSTGQSVADFQAYVSDGTALDITEQWNTHTYSVSNKDRADIRALSTANNKILWMSEVGSGGSGIMGNLSMAQKLMNDIRYLRPEAWIDWQYVEELNDQWCFLQGSFTLQTYHRVKNYYVRQQFSKYIPIGSTFLFVPNDQALAAMSPTGDSLIIVFLNNSAVKAQHWVDLSMFDQIGNITATRTSETENNATISGFTLKDSTLSILLPGYSITTLVLPVNVSQASNELKTDVPYLILPRTASLAMKSVDNSIIIDNYKYGDSTQIWKLKETTGGYMISNLAGRTITDAGSYYTQASIVSTGDQVFQIESVGDDCYKVLSSSTGKALDLELASNAAGTKIGLWDYGTSPAASHRQWIFYAVPSVDTTNSMPNGIEVIAEPTVKVHIFGTDNAIIILQPANSDAFVDVYTLTGMQLVHKEVKGTLTRISLHSGVYIVCHRSYETGKLKTSKVLVE